MSKIAKATIGLMIVTMISKILGFTRELVLASTYGTSIYTDAYLISSSIPTTILSIIVGGLGTTVIPLYYEIKRESGELESKKFINNVTNIVIILSIIIAIVGFIFADKIVGIFAMGFEGERLARAIRFTKIFMVGVIFIGISNIMTIFLQINNEFKIPGLIGLPYNSIIILSILLSIKYNPNILAYGTLIAMLGQCIFQIPFALRQGYRYSLYVNIKDKNIKKILKLLVPIFIGIGVVQLNVIVDKTIASTLQEGIVSSLNYANKLNSFVMVLFIASIASVIYPTLSSLNYKDDKDKTKFNDLIVKSINSTILLIIPISVGAIVLAEPIIKILFQRGAFTYNDTMLTSVALIFYSIGMIGFALRDVLIKIFYSIQDTKTPVVNGSIAMLINIALNKLT